MIAFIRRAARTLIKIVAGMAVVVFIFANPIGNNSGLAFMASIIVLVTCAMAWAVLEHFGGTEEEPDDRPQSDK